MMILQLHSPIAVLSIGKSVDVRLLMPKYVWTR
jgi:hypothetical protein